MESSGLKAREIEALVYIQSPQHIAAKRTRRRPGTLGLHATSLGVGAIVVVAAVLGWVLLRS